MLILTRKQDEEIIINSGIRIRILSAGENYVKIGISAPPEVEILRGEIYENVKKSTIDATKNSAENIEALKSLKIKKLGG